MTPPAIAPAWFDDELEEEGELDAGGEFPVREGDCEADVPLVSAELGPGVVLGV